MTSALKILISLIIAFGIALLALINCKLYYKPEIKISKGNTINHDLTKQLAFLKVAMHRNSDHEMQSLYPEGYIFMNALYGLTWINVLEKSDAPSALHKEGHEEIERAFGKINSGEGRAIFDDTLPLPYGSFYTGWSSYLLGRKLMLETASVRDKVQINYFKEQCKKIAKAIQDKTYPLTYRGGIWPADVMLCVASLSIHDKLFTPLYTATIKTWIAEVKTNVDSNGLIPHEINYKDQSIAEKARGSSQSLMLIFLNEIDPEFARAQYTVYKEKFVDTRLGLTGIREYPKGDYGTGDVDSGPVILQMGGSATIVGMQTLNVYGDYELSQRIRSTIEGLALPVEKDDQKFYAFGLLPMADMFIAWSHSSDNITKEYKSSFITFHLFSAGIIFSLLFILWWLWKKKRVKQN